MLKSIHLLFFTGLFILALVFVFILTPATLSIVDLKNKVEVKIGSQYIIAEVANNPQSRAKGLSGREGLGINEGMLFVFKEPGMYGFWMKDMLFPIDIIWIRDGEIIGWEKNVKPQWGVKEKDLTVYYPKEPVNFVLEIPANRLDLLNVKENQKVFIRTILPFSRALAEVR